MTIEKAVRIYRWRTLCFDCSAPAALRTVFWMRWLDGRSTGRPSSHLIREKRAAQRRAVKEKGSPAVSRRMETLISLRRWPLIGILDRAGVPAGIARARVRLIQPWPLIGAQYIELALVDRRP